MIKVNGKQNNVRKDLETGGHRTHSGNGVQLYPGAQGMGIRGQWEPERGGLPEHSGPQCQARGSHPKLGAEEK